MNKIFKHIKNYSTQWIFLYAVIFIIRIVLLLCIYMNSDSLVNKYVRQYNDTLLVQAKTEIDTEIDNVKKFILNIPIDNDLKLLSQTNDVSRLDMMFYGVDERIKSYAQGFQINSYYLYLKNNNRVISKSGILSCPNGFLAFTDGYQTSAAEFTQILQNTLHMEYFILNPTVDTLPPKLLLIHSLPNSNGIVKNINVVAEINTNKISADLTENNFDGSVSLFDRNGALLFTFGENNGITELNNSLSSGESTVQTINGEKMLVTVKDSGFGKYIYVVSTPLAKFEHQIVLIRLSIVLLIIFFILIEGVFIYQYSKLAYNPLRNIIEKIDRTIAGESDKENNKYNITTAKLQDIEKNLDMHINKYNYGKEAVFQALFMRILSFEYNDFKNNEFNDVLEPYTGNNFVAIIDSHNYRNFFYDCSEAQSRENFHFIVDNVLGELLSDSDNTIVSFDNLEVCIIAIHNENNSSYIKEHYYGVFEKFTEFFSENFGIDTKLSLGSIENGVAGIRKSFLNAGEAIKYAAFYPDEVIFDYYNIQSRKDSFDYSKNDENFLINYIQSGEAENAIAHIRKIIDVNFNERDTSYSYIKFLLFNITVTVYKATNSVENSTPEVFNNYENIEDYIEKISVVIDKYCRRSKELMAHKKENSVIDQINEYLEENYSNSMLSNSDIAKYCGISPAYLSTVFKKTANKNLVDYITEFRINKAKELYLKNGTSITEVAKNTGFISSSTFIRAFKKIEGITPGQYQKNNS
ncbi:MAG: helix-turn-helix transcriptional regulator [Clostridia bacterium]|nr:helix-turn-helix transcriptional regulator [Clostridia bacterium]